jgi:molybdate transport system ATP-binding protein
MKPKTLDPQALDDAGASPVLFRLDGATLRVGPRRLLPDTNWTLRVGQNWVIMGDNGSGKTTLAGTLTGETAVVAGRRWVDRSRWEWSAVRRVSFEAHQRLVAWDENQDEARGFAQLESRGVSVRRVLETRRRAAGAKGAALQTWLRQTGLAAWLDREIRNLSTGEIRQVMIARALLAAPRLLIVDEPFDGLDAAARRRLVDMLSTLMAGGLQMILITHHADEILPGITHYLRLHDGRLAEQGRWRPAADTPVTGPAVSGDLPAPAEAVVRPVPDPRGDAAAPDLIRMRDVTVAYDGRRVLDRLTWSVRPGENWVVCGPNGSGKSTLLQLVCGDNPQAYANEIYLFGRRRGSGETIWDIKRSIGLVSNALQIRYRKPLDGLAVILSGYFDSVGLYRRASAAQVEAARGWAARLDIEHLLDRPFRQLSNGERRMLLIARAMVKAPRLLILDEPCQGLDPHNRMRLLAMFGMIVTTHPTQLIYVSHRPDEVPACTTHALHLQMDGSHTISAR